MPRTLLFALILLGLAQASTSQTIPPRGDATTFEVASWNVKWFGNPTQAPSNDALQRENVAAVLRGADIDLWAMQEVADPTAWATLMADLQADGLIGQLGPAVSTDPSFDQRLAFAYDPTAVSVILTRTLPSSIVTAFNFGGRAPFEMLANVSANGASRTMRIINFHAKASGGFDDFSRRLAGSIELKAYTDDLIAQGVSVIILGDMNDELTSSTASGQVSPYRNFALDTDRYDIATRTLDATNAATFCSNNACTSGSTLDHIFFASPLFPNYVANSGDRFIELASLIANYRTTTSDHLPVFAKFALATVDAEESAQPDAPIILHSAAPNPFSDRTAIRFRLDAPANVRADVFDALGRLVHTVDSGFGSGEQRIALDGAALPPGVYVVRVESNGVAATQRIVRAE